MEARVARLERDSELTRASLARIEKLVSDVATDLRDSRREVREQELPNIRAQLAALDAALKEKPTGKDFFALAQSMNATLFKAFGMAVGLLVAGAGLLAWLHRQGVL